MIHRSWASRIIRLAHAAVCTSSPLWTRVTGRQGVVFPELPGGMSGLVRLFPCLLGDPCVALASARGCCDLLEGRGHILFDSGDAVLGVGYAGGQLPAVAARRSKPIRQVHGIRERVRPSRRWDAPGGPRLHVRYWHRVQPRVGPDLQRTCCARRDRAGERRSDALAAAFKLSSSTFDVAGLPRVEQPNFRCGSRRVSPNTASALLSISRICCVAWTCGGVELPDQPRAGPALHRP